VGFLSFTISHAVGGYDVRGYHAANLAIHVLAAWILYDVVRRTLSRGRRTECLSDSATGLAFAVALIWLVHPLHPNTITYIYQRLESLMALFYLATLWCFLRANDSSKSGYWYAASVACCALGMGTKEVMVTAPLVVLWYDRLFVAKSWNDLIKKRRLYYLA